MFAFHVPCVFVVIPIFLLDVTPPKCYVGVLTRWLGSQPEHDWV